MTSRFALGLVIAAVLAGNARAAEAPVKAVVHPGSLSLAPPRDVTSPAERSHGVLRMLEQVTDARGNGGGWVLDAHAAGPTRVLDVVVRCAARSTCSLPADRPQTPAVLRAGRAAPLLAAGRGTGMGRIEVLVTLGGVRAGFSLRPA
jgi:hypothetical protein